MFLGGILTEDRSFKMKAVVKTREAIVDVLNDCVTVHTVYPDGSNKIEYFREGSCIFVGEMFEYCGKEVEVNRLTDGRYAVGKWVFEENMFEEFIESVDPVPSFDVELTALINRHSVENGSNTPDFMLAEHLLDCLENFNRYVKRRDRWHEHESDSCLSGVSSDRR